jgi:hypothetical protein
VVVSHSRVLYTHAESAMMLAEPRTFTYIMNNALVFSFKAGPVFVLIAPGVNVGSIVAASSLPTLVVVVSAEPDLEDPKPPEPIPVEVFDRLRQVTPRRSFSAFLGRIMALDSSVLAAATQTSCTPADAASLQSAFCYSRRSPRVSDDSIWPYWRVPRKLLPSRCLPSWNQGGQQWWRSVSF